MSDCFSVSSKKVGSLPNQRQVHCVSWDVNMGALTKSKCIAIGLFRPDGGLGGRNKSKEGKQTKSWFWSCFRVHLAKASERTFGLKNTCLGTPLGYLSCNKIRHESKGHLLRRTKKALTLELF